jgi:GNAT superfamily N-acetyltransferase
MDKGLPLLPKKKMRLATYTHEELGEKPWLLDKWIDFIERAIPDEGFAESHFTGPLAQNEVEKKAYLVFHPLELERVESIAFTLQYRGMDALDEGPIYLMLIAVDPEGLRQGQGSKLLQYILSTNPLSEVWVKIHRENTASKRFFKKHGFVKTTKKAMHPRLNPSYRLQYDPYVHRPGL